jgi:hypothetical protein
MTLDEYQSIHKDVMFARLKMDEEEFNEFFSISSSQTPNGYFYNMSELLNFINYPTSVTVPTDTQDFS